jgi:hypothetical protein
MSLITTIEEGLQRAVSPLPAPMRAWLRSVFYAVSGKPAESMRGKNDNANAMLGGLRDLIDELQKRGVNGDAVEVGSYAGESAEYFAKHFRSLTAVDPWMFLGNIERAFDERMKPYSNVRKLKMKSDEGATHFADASLDFVYIDADHHEEFVREDIRLWLPKVKPGGILAGHDYSEKEVGVRRAVDDLLGKPDRIFADSSWMKLVASIR